MSKSLGNVYTLPDVLARGYRASALRYLLLSSHYRKQLNFTWAGMEQAEESLRRIVRFPRAARDGVRRTHSSPAVQAAIEKARAAFAGALLGRPEHGRRAGRDLRSGARRQRRDRRQAASAATMRMRRGER